MKYKFTDDQAQRVLDLVNADLRVVEQVLTTLKENGAPLSLREEDKKELIRIRRILTEQD